MEKFPFQRIFSHVLMFFASLCQHLIYNIYNPFLYEKPLFQNKNVVHDTFFKQQFVLVLSHASDNSTSRNIERMDAWAVPPPPKFFWGGVPCPPPPSPLLPP